MMLKKIALFSSLLFLLFGANVFAHSHIEDSSPKNGEVLTEPLKNITLSFETAVEQTSTFTLTDANGTEISLPGVTINGNQLNAKVENELSNGSYTIHWKIIGEDGHPLEGDIPFTVQLPEAAIQNETVETVVNSTEESETAEVMKQQAVETKQAESEGPGLMNYIIPGSIGIIIILGFASYWLIFKRKHA